jgi:hypothetical protein
MFDKYTTVNGIRVKLTPFSESRYKKLRVINEDIAKWLGENPEMTFNDLPVDKKEEWWRAKSDILWVPDKPFSDGFFADEDFEAGMLKDTEDNFVLKRLYL